MHICKVQPENEQTMGRRGGQAVVWTETGISIFFTCYHATEHIHLIELPAQKPLMERSVQGFSIV